MPQYIYAIINECNHKFYVGRTKDLCKRFSQHFRSLINQNHDNIHLQHAWNKYNQKFSFTILHKINYNDESLNLTLAQNIEQAYINEFMNKDIIYNISNSSTTPVITGKNHHFYGKSNREWMTEKQYQTMILRRSQQFKGKNNPFYGRTHSKESKRKMSNARKKQIQNGSYIIHNCQKVKINGKIYHSLSSAGRYLKMTRYKIKKYCNDPTNSNFQFI